MDLARHGISDANAWASDIEYGWLGPGEEG
jgi:hypothetical protein